ncbi:hypothetical protein IWQ56_001106 [Coemansia nantahalensis]|nr:hypothetical protein IWQ56_001106 [Coemansia nantahalensis]
MGAPIAATEGISKDIAINAQQVPIDPAAFEGIGVAEDGLRALCVSDQQGPGRELIAELLVALPAATTLRARATDGEALLECRPIHAREPILLYLHGGGYVVGNRHICRPLTRWISEDASVRVLSAEYRLAPEHPFPAAVHDALIVYKFLLQQGFGADRIIVGGDSAGGHLVLALTHLVRFMRIAQPAALVLISPVANMSRNAPSLARNRNYDSLAMSPVESPISFARMYHRPGRQLTEQLRAELADMLLSPVNGDFAGFPPTLIQGGSIELFIDDITELHAAISAQNPDSPDLAVLEAFTDMPHVFHGLAHRPEAKRATASIVRFIRRVAEMDS